MKKIVNFNDYKINEEIGFMPIYIDISTEHKAWPVQNGMITEIASKIEDAIKDDWNGRIILRFLDKEVELSNRSPKQILGREVKPKAKDTSTDSKNDSSPLYAFNRVITEEEDEDKIIKNIDSLLKQGFKLNDARNRPFKAAAKAYKLKVLKHLLDKMKSIDPKKLDINWYELIAFYVENSDDLDKTKRNAVIEWLKDYSGFDLKEYLS